MTGLLQGHQLLMFVFGTLLLVSSTNGFVVVPKTQSSTIKSSSSLFVGIDPQIMQEMTNSRSAFGLYLFGSLGTAALGRSAIPVTIDRIKLNNALAKEGETKDSLGGANMQLGYPGPVFEDDVREVLDNPMSMTEIVDKFPIPGKIRGFLSYEAFAKANPNSSPLAVKAVWDAFALGINTKVVSPFTAQGKFDKFREDMSEIKSMLLYGKIIGIVAFLLLLGGLGTADGYAAYHGWKGWFPEWPGLNNFPFSFVDPSTGILAIPKYYTWNIPPLSTP